MTLPENFTNLVFTLVIFFFCVCLLTCQGREDQNILSPSEKIDSLKIDTLKK